MFDIGGILQLDQAELKRITQDFAKAMEIVTTEVTALKTKIDETINAEDWVGVIADNVKKEQENLSTALDNYVKSLEKIEASVFAVHEVVQGTDDALTGALASGLNSTGSSSADGSTSASGSNANGNTIIYTSPDGSTITAPADAKVTVIDGEKDNTIMINLEDAKKTD